MIRLTITVPLDSIPGVEVEASYDHAYMSPQVDMDTSRLSLVFQGEVMEDDDYAEGYGWAHTRPNEAVAVKFGKPRLRIDRTTDA